MAWRVGMKVTMKRSHVWSSDDDAGIWPEPVVMPVFGEVYTIAMTEFHRGNTFLNLRECDHYGMFLAEHFRPVTDKKTDISVFTKLLAPKPKRVRARA